MAASAALPKQDNQPPPERFIPSAPTVHAPPVRTIYKDMDCCGNCPAWKKFHPQAPFGQCLSAIRWLGAPLYTPDLSGCTLPPDIKAKGSSR